MIRADRQLNLVPSVCSPYFFAHPNFTPSYGEAQWSSHLVQGCYIVNQLAAVRLKPTTCIFRVPFAIHSATTNGLCTEKSSTAGVLSHEIADLNYGHQMEG